MILDLEGTFSVGEESVFESISPVSSFGVVFEDDSNTGYLYAIDTAPEFKILDALHVYNVANIIDKQKPCSIKIAWTDDGQFASLLINNYCHAIFDFENKLGYCRTAFPPPTGVWRDAGERIPLTDQLINELLS